MAVRTARSLDEENVTLLLRIQTYMGEIWPLYSATASSPRSVEYSCGIMTALAEPERDMVVTKVAARQSRPVGAWLLPDVLLQLTFHLKRLNPALSSWKRPTWSLHCRHSTLLALFDMRRSWASRGSSLSDCIAADGGTYRYHIQVKSQYSGSSYSKMCLTHTRNSHRSESLHE